MMFANARRHNSFGFTRFFSSHRVSAILPFFLGTLLTFFIVVCHESTSTGASTPQDYWVGTWATAPQLVEPNNMPPKPYLTDNTIRQIVHVSIGGKKLRVRFSNEFSTSPVVIKSAHIASALEASAIDPYTDQELLFNGSPEVTLEPGVAVTSDPVEFVLQPRSNVAITTHFGETSADVTGHPGSRTTSFILEGNKVSAADFLGAKTTDHWYVINGIDVVAPETAAAIAIMGNSITDGRGSGTNKQNRWPDELANRLQENPGTENVAVLNMGIGGNCVIRNCLGPSGVDRFQRDVLAQYGVRWLIILEGVNDIGNTNSEQEADSVATALIDAFESMIEQAHAADILVYGATILPFGTSFYDTPSREVARVKVNEWIRTSGKFDAVIDFDLAMQNPDAPTQLLPDADTGDHLHPNEVGYQMMAAAIDLILFQ